MCDRGKGGAMDKGRMKRWGEASAQTQCDGSVYWLEQRRRGRLWAAVGWKGRELGTRCHLYFTAASSYLCRMNINAAAHPRIFQQTHVWTLPLGGSVDRSSPILQQQLQVIHLPPGLDHLAVLSVLHPCSHGFLHHLLPLFSSLLFYPSPTHFLSLLSDEMLTCTCFISISAGPSKNNLVPNPFDS